MRDLVNLYFKGHNIVNHHVSSFNDFLATDQNPNSRMQRIVDEVSLQNDGTDHGFIRIDVDKESRDGRHLIIRVGRNRSEDGKIEIQSPPTIHVGKNDSFDQSKYIGPVVIEADGSETPLTPMEARLRNLNYCSPVYVDFTVYEAESAEDPIGNATELFTERVKICDLPMMVKSRGCSLDRNIVKNRLGLEEISDEEYDNYLREVKEDPRDPGGYFIVGGTERVLITFEDLAPNRVLVEHSKKTETESVSAKVFSQKDGFRSQAVVELKQDSKDNKKFKDDALNVQLTSAGNSILLIALMKALGMESDADIYNTIVSDERMVPIVYANIERSMDAATYQPNGFHTTEDAYKYLEKTLAQGQAKEYRVKKVDNILDHYLLPHLGSTPADRLKKAIYLGRVARSVLEVSLGMRGVDDKDHYANKRLNLSGDLMEDLFRNSFNALMKDLKYQVEKRLAKAKSSDRKNGSKTMNAIVEPSIRPEILTNKLIHSLATGNWVGGRAGVSQLLDRTTNMSAMSHLRRITSSLTRSQPHFEARDLHPTQWGRLCPSETPEGQNCGLVKNAALIIDVSNGFDEYYLKWLFSRDFNVSESNISSGTRIFLNGGLIGTFDDPEKFVSEVRERRRCGLLDGEINIRYDKEMDEVLINSDEGRLRRPLLIVKNGKTVLAKKHLDGIREDKITWDELFREGIIEWIDAEEEEDTLIAIDAYDVPDKCPLCGCSLSAANVDWMNPGVEGDVELRCKFCDDTFTVPSKLTKEHTHMEVDPMVIIGIASGLVPYPEHNSAPRVTLGAAMAKQALGVPAANYRSRPDTRGHLLHYPQKPMVQTQSMEYVGYNHKPAGQNFCIAVMSFHGYNIEDAIVMNKSSVQRGLGRSTFMRTYRIEERSYPNGIEDKIEIPSPDVEGFRDDEAYRHLDEDGIIPPESIVTGDDVLVGKTSPPHFNSDETYLQTVKRREASSFVRRGETGCVDSVMITKTENGTRLVRIKVRDQRVPELGDKFCSRHGQKGVIGRLVPQQDMPFTIDGITPDIVVNPHGIPSRMTIAHVLEMIGGKVGAMEGRTIDGTVFSGEREQSIRDGLVKNGFKRTGKEVMFDGTTGRKIPVQIYTGVIFYEKLHHMVSGKMHCRSRGPIQVLTRQPTEGRSRQGGLRFGEMERDTLTAHGAAMVIKDRLLDESDGTQLFVCGNPDCGHIAISDKYGSYYCPVCKNNTTISPIETSYAFKLLMDELLSMGVAMRLQLEEMR